MEKKTSLFENGLIWFGAGVSIAEILTGTYFAPLCMAKGLDEIFCNVIIAVNKGDVRTGCRIQSHIPGIG